MKLLASISGRSDVARIGLSFGHLRTEPGSSVIPGWPAYAPGWSLGTFLLMQREWDVPLSFESGYDLLGLPSPEGPFRLLLSGSKPDTLHYVMKTDRDRYAYGYKGFPHPIHTELIAQNSEFGKEKDTSHYGVRGSIQTEDAGPKVHDLYDEYSSTVFVHDHYRTGTFDNPDLDRIHNMIHVSPAEDGVHAAFAHGYLGYDESCAYGYRSDLAHVWAALKSPIHFARDFFSYRNELTWSDFAFDEEVTGEHSGKLVFQCTFTNEAWSHDPPVGETEIVHGLYVYDMKLVIPWALTMPQQNRQMIAGPCRIMAELWSDIHYEFTLISRECNYAEQDPLWVIDSAIHPPTSLIVAEAPALYSHFGLGLEAIAYDDFDRADRHLLWRYKNRGMETKFFDFVTEIHPECRPAAALSANDCLSKYHSSVNLLETIPELPGLLRTFADPRTYKALIRFLKSDLLDVEKLTRFVSEKYLFYVYGAKPLAADTESTWAMVKRVLAELAGLGESFPKVLHGKFTVKDFVKFPYLDGTISLTVRSKMRLRTGPGSLLSIILVMDELGILPTSARMWDLVKFSFVLDWFTRIGDRLEDADQATIRGAFDVGYYVHTYAYSFECDPRSYLPFHSTSNRPPDLRVFLREVSLFHPGLYDSDFDMRPPKGLNKDRLAVSGALLCVLS